MHLNVQILKDGSKMKKTIYKILIILMILSICLGIFTACSSSPKDKTGVNLLKNGSFEETNNGLPTDWSINSWFDEPQGSLRAEAASDAKDGANVAIVECARDDDARFEQTVSVSPNSYYVFSAWIKTEGVDDTSTLPTGSDQKIRVGANLSIIDVYSHSDQLTGDNPWTKITLYGLTGSSEKSMTIALRLGFYSGNNKGKVYFDDATLERIDKLPEGIVAQSFDNAKTTSNNVSTTTSTSSTENTTIAIIFLIAILAAVLGTLLGAYIYKKPSANLFKDKTGLYLLLGIAIVIRIVLAVQVPGFDVDIGCFSAWGDKMTSSGIQNFYSSGYFCDYPPLYMFVLAIVSMLRHLLGVDVNTGMGLLILKLPAICADIISALLIFKLSKEKLGNKIATLLAGFYLLNPAIIVNSSSWGQIDSVLALLLIWCFYLIMKKKYALSVLVYLAAILTKPQAIVFGPIMIFGLINEITDIAREKHSKIKSSRILQLLGVFAGALGIFALISLVMKSDNTSFFWLIQKYISTIQSYKYAALSVFNLDSLFGGQWAPLENNMLLGISFGTAGIIGIVLVALTSFYFYIKNKESKYFWLLAAFLCIGAVILGSSAHERYIFPALIMLLISYIYIQDKRLLYIFGGFSVLHYINVSVVLHKWIISKTYLDSKSAILIIGSLLSVLLFAYLTYVIFDIMIRKRSMPIVTPTDKKQAETPKLTQSNINMLQTRIMLDSRQKPKTKFNWKDYAIIITITVIYSIVAFVNLGDAFAPKTMWYPQTFQDYTIVDFGKQQNIDEIYLNGAKSGGNVTLSYSSDDASWTKIQSIYIDTSMINKWSRVPQQGVNLGISARYVRITTDNTEFAINEMVFRSGGVNIPIVSVDGSNNPLVAPVNNYTALFDKQDSLTAYLASGGKYLPVNSWKSSMAGDGFIIDLGKEENLAQIYGNIAATGDLSQFSLEYSLNKQDWKELTTFMPAENDSENWVSILDSQQQPITARYIKLTAIVAGFQINELALFSDTSAKTMLTPANIEGLPASTNNGDNTFGNVADTNYKACFDEQDTFNAWTAVASSINTGNYWSVKKSSEYVIADFGSVQNVQRMYYYNSISSGTFTIRYSTDKLNWKDIKTVVYGDGMMYKWQLIPDGGSLNAQARYILITADVPYFKMLECAFYSAADAPKPIPIVSVEGNGKDGSYNNVFDEQNLVPVRSSFMNSMYFDEIYHARTAYETLHGMKIYETTHPPLGKDIMSLGVATFGMDPFGWRFTGTLMGILMVPAMYVLGKLIFKKTSFATALTLLMTLDGMHFVQTRIATIDSYGVFFIIMMFIFMYKYYTMNFYDQKLWRTLVPLGLTGIMFGIGSACKWIGVYAGAGLALLLFMVLFERYGEYLHASRSLKSGEKGYSAEEKEHFAKIIKTFPRNTIITLLWCVLFFIIIPVTIYCASYYPYFNVPGNKGSWLATVWDNQKYMFSYHSSLGNDTHPFRSEWYQWPIIYKPMWFYQGSELSVDKMECISTFGNPLIWYTGLLCTLASFVILILKMTRRYATKVKEELVARKREIAMLLFVVIGLATNFVPWLFISRSTFIYHYFASLPFIMIFTVYIWQLLVKKYGKSAKIAMIVFFVFAAIMFAMFYPIWSGMEVSKDYVNTFLRWMGSWYFGS